MGSLEWDFGDPASGTLNTSNQVNPIHTYTQPGTYTVKMTSSNCWNSVTTTKTITIGPFPKIDLGNDITWCLHKKHDELQLKVDIPGATFLWQDLSTADHYTVNKGGVYWVKVSAACEVADSITVNELPCSCDITVSPTLTHTITSFIFECDLSAYDPLALEIYNDRGQIIIRKGITEVITHVNFEQFAAGIYFYQIRDKIEVVKSGKIVFVRK
jgi:PKD repeat protein